MQLGGTAPQPIQQVKGGVAGIVWTLPGYTAGRFPSVEAFELPFMMQNPESTSRTLWDYAHVQGMMAFGDVRPIGFHVHGDGVFHMRDKPVRTMAGLDGGRPPLRRPDGPT